jgi:hypothetical protein
MSLAEGVIWAAYLYACLGALVAFGFVTIGIGRALPDSGPVTPGARILVFWAAVALWPLVLRRWR